jgi:hypothetical protein
MAISHAVLGRIQAGFQPEEEWKRTSLPMPFFILSDSRMRLKEILRGFYERFLHRQ